MASSIYGTAFLNIQPDLKGFGTSLTRGVGAASATAGGAAGSGFAAAFLKGVVAIGIGRAIVGQITSSINESLEFESAFAGVLKTVEGTVTQIDGLRTGIIEMSKVLPASREEIAGVAEAAGQLGIQTENILEFTKVMIDLGETTDLTADQAATSFAQIANVMGTSQKAFDAMASTLVDLGNKGASTESQIIDFAQRIAGAGEIAGLAESDVLAIGSAMASVGIEAESGGTAVQKVLIGITRAVATTNDDLNVFAETAGLSARAFAEAWEEDAAGAFTLFVEGLGRAGDDAFDILDQLNLKDQRLIRSFLSLSGAGELLRTQIDIGTTAWDDNSAATEEANKRYETAAARLDIVKNRATELQRQLGDQLVPIIVDLAEQHIPALENAFKDLTTSMPGELDAQDVVNWASTSTRAFGLVVSDMKAASQTATGIAEVLAGQLSGGMFGDTQAGLDRITGAWKDFAQDNVFRTATESMVQALQAGEEPALALANALAFVGRRGKIDPKVVRTLTQIADVDPSQLVLELERLVELGPELGLGADDIDTLRIALLDLGPPSIEAVRQANLLARAGAGPLPLAGTLKELPDLAFDVGDAVGQIASEIAELDDEDITFSKFIFAMDGAADHILELLDPAERLSLRLGIIGSDAEAAGFVIENSLVGAIDSVTDAFVDANKDLKVSGEEFIEGLIDSEKARIEFNENLLIIATVFPATAQKLSEAGADIAAGVAADFAANLTLAEQAEPVILQQTDEIAGLIERMTETAVSLVQTDPAALDFYTAFAASLGVPGLTRSITNAVNRHLGLAVEGADVSGIGGASAGGYVDGFVAYMLSHRAIDRLRSAITSTIDSAIYRDSPPKLFVDIGKESGQGFWDGFASEQVDPDSFGVDDLNILSKIRQATGSVSFDAPAAAGGLTIESFQVNNPIGEPTEESVQSALLEVAISPIVNRLVSAGSSG